jgi:hypothetical protein
MYFLDVETAVASVHDFWATVAVTMPPVIHIAVDPHGDVIDDASGDLVGQWASTPETSVTGSGGDQFAAPAGAAVTWETDTFLDGHRLRGRTYIVPMSYGSYQSDGTLGETTKPNLTSAAGALVTSQSTSFVVWHRPRLARAATDKLKALSAHDGGHGLVTMDSLSDKVAILTSRR